eukprot:403908-Prorocentrum_minimum.AAC.1
MRWLDNKLCSCRALSPGIAGGDFDASCKAEERCKRPLRADAVTPASRSCRTFVTLVVALSSLVSHFRLARVALSSRSCRVRVTL